MSWRIHLVQNDVKINAKVEKDLLEYFDEGECLRYAGRLNFNPDHMEHMDYVASKDVQAVLKKHKVKGDICFTSNEGDNQGSSWGYRFDGKGGMVKLEGRLVFEPIKRSRRAKK